MKQFDVYTNTDKETNKAYPYFVDVQNGLLNSLNSRVVIPLTPARKPGKNYPSNLCPIIKIQNKNYFLLTHQLASVSTSFLKKNEGSLASSRDDIVGAIDFLVTGI
ncbi:CcdB family protein [Dasania marina]|uniref:CcdB family protein n=1 Tax=Dasania marina TaxID=471499 RepID=UPI0030D87788|tara:strand:+ start:7159 stop:7476 length:318 start_codon:yes stop_codon:yes gene_type:complete